MNPSAGDRLFLEQRETLLTEPGTDVRNNLAMTVQ